MFDFDFDHEQPGTLAEAVTLLERSAPGGRIIAGGTDLLPNMRVDVLRPTTLISLSRIEPESPRRDAAGAIRIDALTRLAAIAESPFIGEELPLLAESARAVGGNQIRHMGTLGGNLCQDTRCLYLNQRHDYQFVAPCHKRGGTICYPFPQNKPDTCWSVYMSDVAPALIALDAEVETVGGKGARRLSVEALFTGSGLTPLGIDRDEIISAVVVPPQPGGARFGYHKSARRGGLEFAMAVIAARLRIAEDGKSCMNARIAMGAVRERPLRMPAAERMLSGAVLNEASIGAAVAAALDELKPLPHHGYIKSDIVDNVRVYLRRVLERAAGGKNGQVGSA